MQIGGARTLHTLYPLTLCLTNTITRILIKALSLIRVKRVQILQVLVSLQRVIIKPRPPFLPKMTYFSKEIDDFPL